ncbi:Aldehyde dehydrogenase 2B4 isoform 1 [Hibiscus syriacus]|uniref:Aldehyde dehydrogenase 2B4 isoform 1 n=1 Tax=Hibiscus syriacus TaxID=106335 RepID=A0A6A2WMF5_HIBSY|nr:Aldehyde dehydrogenase 2B4 isoform 1 [Hibiscus syriacus]
MNSILPSFRYLPSIPASTTTGARPPPSKADAPTDSCLVFNPTSDIVSSWNHVFSIICIMALFIDRLYFFHPYVGGLACLASDAGMGVFITVLRSMVDLLYLINMLMKFRTGFIAPSSRVFGKGELVMDTRDYPAFVIWVLILTTRNSRTDYANSSIALIVLLQYVPRLFIIFPLNNKIIKTNGILAKTAWAGAAYNLLLYLLASHARNPTYLPLLRVEEWRLKRRDTKEWMRHRQLPEIYSNVFDDLFNTNGWPQEDVAEDGYRIEQNRN